MKYNLPSLKALRAAEAVGRHESITRAASELHVTPGAVSRHITLLEDYFDCKLFTRHATGLALTEVGEHYVSSLSEAFDLIDQACSKILRSGERTSLVIRALGAFGSEWLLPRISQFENQHPDIEVSIRATLEQVDFDTDDADVGLVGDIKSPEGVESIKLYTPYLIPIVSAKLAKNSPKVRSAADLKHFKLMHLTVIEPSWDQWLAEVAPDHEIDTTRGYWLERSSQMYQSVRQGAGVGLGQLLLIGEELVQGTLAAPLNHIVPAPFSIYLVWPKRKKTKPEVKFFQEWLTRELAVTEEKLTRELPHFHSITDKT